MTGEPSKMRALCAEPDGSVQLRAVEAPRALPGQLAIDTACTLISPGTESLYRRRAAAASAPSFLGYCASGVVRTVGEGVPEFSVGDRVIAMGLNHAIHAERICAPWRLCVRIEGDTPFEQAVFANLLATALHAVDRAALSPRDRVLVVGAGLVGQLVAQRAALTSADVRVTDLKEARRAAAERAGIRSLLPGSTWAEAFQLDDRPPGVDVIFLCVHGEATELFARCLQALARDPDATPRGRLVCVGRFDATVRFGVELGNVDIRYAARCGLGYKDADYVHGRREYPGPLPGRLVDEYLREALALVASRRVVIDPLHSARIPFDRAPSAYRLLETDDAVIGVTLHYETEDGR